jgi:hypothetical protein
MPKPVISRQEIMNAIAKLTKATGQTQRQVATAVGITDVWMCNICSGAPISWELRAKLDKLFGVDTYMVQWALDDGAASMPKGMQPEAIALQTAILDALEET